MPLELSLLADTFAVCKLAPKADIPGWASGDFYALTRTADELSIVCPEKAVPEDVPHESSWRCLKVAGPLDFGLTGVLASLLTPLAEAGISVFAISTFNTDYLLVKSNNLERVIHSLRAAGHSVKGGL
jgi:hypothetical protein